MRPPTRGRSRTRSPPPSSSRQSTHHRSHSRRGGRSPARRKTHSPKRRVDEVKEPRYVSEKTSGALATSAIPESFEPARSPEARPSASSPRTTTAWTQEGPDHSVLMPPEQRPALDPTLLKKTDLEDGEVSPPSQDALSTEMVGNNVHAPTEPRSLRDGPRILPTAPRALRTSTQQVHKVSHEQTLGMATSSTPVPPTVPPPPLPVDPRPPPEANERGNAPKTRLLSEVDAKDDALTWVERIKLLSEAQVARSELLQAKSDLKSLGTFKDTSYFAALSDGAKADHAISMEQADNCKKEKTKELREAIDKLAAVGRWFPAGLAETSTASEGEAQIANASGVQGGGVGSGIGELKEMVVQLQSLAQSTGLSRHTPSDSRSVREHKKLRRKSPSRAVSPDVEMTDAFADYTKRRFPSNPEPPEDIEILRNLMMDFEGRIVSVENEAAQQEQEWLDEVEEAIEEKLRALRHSTPQPAASWEESYPELARALKNADQKFQSTGDDISELAQGVADLITEQNVSQRFIADLRNENAELRRCLEETQTRHRSQLDAMRQDMLQMAQTVSRLEQERTAVETNSLGGLSTEILAQLLGPALDATIRQKMQPLVAEAYQSVQQMLKEHTDDVATNVMSKVAVAVQVSEAINAWLRNSQFAVST